MKLLKCLGLVLIGLLFPAVPLTADEGLWPYNQFPVDALKQKNGFETPAGFLDHLRLSSVRIGGGSGAFVSREGLILTSRQEAASCNLPADGFVAADRAGELRCPGLDASVLLSIEDVGSQLKTTGQSLVQRNAAIAKIEKDCAARTGNVCSVVRLFSGGRYDLYRYKRYSDIRLVFAPEYSAAFFGKERDSITYLRYGLNVAFLRAFEKRSARGYAGLSQVEPGRSEGGRFGLRLEQSPPLVPSRNCRPAYLLSRYRAPH